MEISIPSALSVKYEVFEKCAKKYGEDIKEIVKRIEKAREDGNLVVQLEGITVNDYIRHIFSEKGYMFEIDKNADVYNQECINLSKSK